MKMVLGRFENNLHIVLWSYFKKLQFQLAQPLKFKKVCAPNSTQKIPNQEL
jgi:hypothetical protein